MFTKTRVVTAVSLSVLLAAVVIPSEVRAQREGGAAAPAAAAVEMPPPTTIEWAAGKTKVLIITGGTSHDFARFFGGTDRETLQAAGFSVNYTENVDQAVAELARADVALVSVNRRGFDTPAYRAALFEFARSGKGLVLMHSATWFGSYRTVWPEMYATLVGGGARGHDAPDPARPFSVKAVKPAHPVMKGVPASFDVIDELYYINAEGNNPPGTVAIDVLAETSPSLQFKIPHPAIWITSHPQARIVVTSLGHDQRTHDHPAFKTLLVNATRWVARLP